jgi:hypothetical protein
MTAVIFLILSIHWGWSPGQCRFIGGRLLAGFVGGLIARLRSTFHRNSIYDGPGRGLAKWISRGQKVSPCFVERELNTGRPRPTSTS